MPGCQALAIVGAVLLGCACRAPVPAQQASAGGADGYAAARKRMVSAQLAARGIRDPRVLEAMRQVPRHLFVPEDLRDRAYDDAPVPIGSGQTISQPYIVALMTELLRPRPGDRVLEVGTGSGYQAAVLSPLVDQVYTIEVVDELAREAEERLRELGYENVAVRSGDGYAGWPERAPFDAIVVTAAPEQVPPALIEQLAPGGRLVIPVGPRVGGQVLRLIEKDERGRLSTRDVAPVMFVPFVRREGAGRPR